ncbi:MAG: sulfurtransferase [Betaproteobacteria bacterium RIFCSPLOWO2_12_FULL_62_13]|nr:MAG: sulfurtransferase [Betaproteobacteria bacterium RIFCSPLOWO2_12_FULL_62_13]
MHFPELNRSKCKTYLVACERTRKALLIDPVKDNISRYLAFLGYHQLKLDAIVDTHTHADHPTGSFHLRDLAQTRLIMHRRAPVPAVDEHVEHGDCITIGDIALQVLYTPGHTPDSISLYAGDRVFTGDVLLIGGTGRADFAGGDAGQQYDSITQKLFGLPEETLVFPAHDYRGNTCSTIGQEKKQNPRIAGRTREQYVALMASLNFPMPEKIQEVLQPNQSAIDDDKTKFPDLTELNRVRQLTAEEVSAMTASTNPPLLLDVREPGEYNGELGHICGSLLIPLRELAGRAAELGAHRERVIVAVCRSGVRSTTAAAILSGLGFERVYNLKDGMVDWNDRRFPVER